MCLCSRARCARACARDSGSAGEKSGAAVECRGSGGVCLSVRPADNHEFVSRINNRPDFILLTYKKEGRAH